MKRIIVCFGMIGVLFCGLVFGQEKNETKQKPKPKIENVDKVLFLEIIEENWDNIEMSFGKGWPLTLKKKEMLNYRQNTQKLPEEKIIAGFIDKKSKIFAIHKIEYLRNFNELKDNEIPKREIGRWGDGYFVYTLPNIYGKIPISKPQYKYSLNSFKKSEIPQAFWRDFKWVRFVNDINITMVDENGNIRFDYNNQKYNCESNSKMEFPIQEWNLSSLKFQWDDITGQWKNGDELPDYKEWDREEKEKLRKNWMISPKENNFKEKFFYIRTKITIINHGFIKLGD